MNEITQEKVNELFEYRDGLLFWKVRKKYGPIQVGDRAGSMYNYRQVQIGDKMFKAHRIIYLMFHGTLPEIVDHIDNDPNNNRIENLRACTRAENNRNTTIRKDNTSGVKGVHWCKRDKKWIVRVGTYLGYFDELSKATEAARHYRKVHHKEFARES
jgi:hypothetical protein